MRIIAGLLMLGISSDVEASVIWPGLLSIKQCSTFTPGHGSKAVKRYAPSWFRASHKPYSIRARNAALSTGPDDLWWGLDIPSQNNPKDFATLSLRECNYIQSYSVRLRVKHLRIYDQNSIESKAADEILFHVLRGLQDNRSLHLKGLTITDVPLAFLPQGLNVLSLEECHNVHPEFTLNLPKSLTHLSLTNCKRLNDQTLSGLDLDTPHLKRLRLKGINVTPTALAVLLTEKPDLVVEPMEYDLIARSGRHNCVDFDEHPQD